MDLAQGLKMAEQVARHVLVVSQDGHDIRLLLPPALLLYPQRPLQPIPHEAGEGLLKDLEGADGVVVFISQEAEDWSLELLTAHGQCLCESLLHSQLHLTAQRQELTDPIHQFPHCLQRLYLSSIMLCHLFGLASRDQVLQFVLRLLREVRLSGGSAAMLYDAHDGLDHGQEAIELAIDLLNFPVPHEAQQSGQVQHHSIADGLLHLHLPLRPPLRLPGQSKHQIQQSFLHLIINGFPPYIGGLDVTLQARRGAIGSCSKLSMEVIERDASMLKYLALIVSEAVDQLQVLQIESFRVAEQLDQQEEQLFQRQAIKDSPEDAFISDIGLHCAVGPIDGPHFTQPQQVGIGGVEVRGGEKEQVFGELMEIGEGVYCQEGLFGDAGGKFLDDLLFLQWCQSELHALQLVLKGSVAGM